MMIPVRQKKARYPPDFIERFWKKIEKDDSEECWEWLGCCNDKGYGQVGVNGIMKYVHRISWELSRGMKIPKGMYICHKCDNRRCCNPRHLFLGTPKDNSQDMVMKERGTGSFTKQHVEKIFILLEKGVSQRSVAKQFDTKQCTISAIATGRNYSHLFRDTKRKTNKVKLTLRIAREIRKKYSTGKYTHKQLGIEYGVSRLTICDLLNNKTWRENEGN